MRSHFYAFLLLLTLFACNKKSEYNIYGIWKSNNNSILELTEYGNGVKIIHTEVNKYPIIYTGTYANEILNINDNNSGLMTLPVNNDKLVFKGIEYQKVVSNEEIIKPKNIKELAQLIFKSIETKTPQILKRCYPDDSFFANLKQNCTVNSTWGGFNEEDKSRLEALSYEKLYSIYSWELLEDIAGLKNMNFSNIKYDSHFSTSLEVLTVENLNFKCKELYDETGQLQIKGKRNGEPFFVFIGSYVKLLDGYIYILSSPQIASSGEVLEDRSEQMKLWEKK